MSAPSPEPADPAGLAAELAEARFERELALKAQARLARELERAERRLAESEAERAALRTRLEERERYLAAVRASKPWKLVQFLRGLVGRRW